MSYSSSLSTQRWNNSSRQSLGECWTSKSALQSFCFPLRLQKNHLMDDPISYVFLMLGSPRFFIRCGGMYLPVILSVPGNHSGEWSIFCVQVVAGLSLSGISLNHRSGRPPWECRAVSRDLISEFISLHPALEIDLTPVEVERWMCLEEMHQDSHDFSWNFDLSSFLGGFERIRRHLNHVSPFDDLTWFVQAEAHFIIIHLTYGYYGKLAAQCISRLNCSVSFRILRRASSSFVLDFYQRAMNGVISGRDVVIVVASVLIGGGVSGIRILSNFRSPDHLRLFCHKEIDPKLICYELPESDPSSVYFHAAQGSGPAEPIVLFQGALAVLSVSPSVLSESEVEEDFMVTFSVCHLQGVASDTGIPDQLILQQDARLVAERPDPS
ncbi:hypothetical protein Tco_1212802 [Tanacetum coccineum]